MENLSFNEMREISGGGIYRIVDTDCDGNQQVYFWDSETGECWTVIGTPKQPC